MTMHADPDKRGLEAAARKIITVMQLQDFGHEDPEGNFHTTGQKIDKLEQSAAIAAEAAIRAYLSTAAPDGWRPIETADRGCGRMLLGTRRNGRIEEVHVGGWLDAINDDEVSCWWSDQADDEICPTHWAPLIPLPSPPLQQEGQSNG